jgi:hypothetical protein
MPITHDGIRCPLPLSPVTLLLGAALLGGGAWLGWSGSVFVGAGLGLLGALFLLNLIGSRRVRVIETKLLVEDEPLLVAFLIGPRRRRITWEEVRGVHVAGGRLRLDTDGAPFVTAEGAAPEDLEALRMRIEGAREKARREGVSG